MKTAKTPDEIKKGLEVCNIWMVDEPNRCMECPYFCTKDCADTLMKHALALIQQLEADNANQREAIRVLELSLQAINATNIEQEHKIWQLEAERDAAVRTIYEMAKCITEDVCEWCDGVECERLCMPHTILSPGFKWRGVQKEE